MIDIETLLAPIPGDNPAGEDLRYTPIYDEIKEARRADDPLDRGEWEHEIKTADWEKVVALCVEALTEKTKDLQIAAWLTEAITKTRGFKGFASGLSVVTGLLSNLWDELYPEIDEGDLDFRVGPLEFLNNHLWLALKEIPLTDPRALSGYSWIKWQESREVGYEKDTVNQYGDVDDVKRAKRNERIEEGKLTAEDFDNAVAASSNEFYTELGKAVASCLEGFKTFDETVDEKFGKEAPRLSEIRGALEDCQTLVSRILKEKGVLEPEARQEETREAGADEQPEAEQGPAPVGQVDISRAVGPSPSFMANDSDSMEQAAWQDALNTLQNSSIKDALGKLRDASLSAPSIRQKNRYRLLMAKLCLRANRADLARPIVEELHALIEQLSLEQWESPMWIAEIIDAYYKCLTAEGASDDDIYRAHNELFQRLCTRDITKAITYKA
jgi:type VI secretion system protein ImpA